MGDRGSAQTWFHRDSSLAATTDMAPAYVGLKEVFTKEFEALSRALEKMERADALPVSWSADRTEKR